MLKTSGIEFSNLATILARGATKISESLQMSCSPISQNLGDNIVGVLSTTEIAIFINSLISTPYNSRKK